jgi:hypothetical protein
VALEKDLVARLAVVLATEKVVEADFVQAGGAGIGRDVAADAVLGTVRAADHDRGVPPDVSPDPALDVLVAREPRLALRRDGVDEVGAGQRRDADRSFTGSFEQLEHEKPGSATSLLADDRVQRLEPLTRLGGVDVGDLAGKAVGDYGVAPGGVLGHVTSLVGRKQVCSSSIVPLRQRSLLSEGG